MSPQATLYYGFHLGCPDEEWAAALSERWTDSEDGFESVEDLPWAQAAADDDDDFVAHMQVHLLAEAEVEAADMNSKELAGAVAREWGVQFVRHGCFSNGLVHIGLAMQSSVYEADDWTPKCIAPSMAGNHVTLLDALEALGLKPNQANPSWILAPGEG